MVQINSIKWQKLYIKWQKLYLKKIKHRRSRGANQILSTGERAQIMDSNKFDNPEPNLYCVLFPLAVLGNWWGVGLHLKGFQHLPDICHALSNTASSIIPLLAIESRPAFEFGTNRRKSSWVGWCSASAEGWKCHMTQESGLWFI